MDRSAKSVIAKAGQSTPAKPSKAKSKTSISPAKSKKITEEQMIASPEASKSAEEALDLARHDSSNSQPVDLDRDNSLLAAQCLTVQQQRDQKLKLQRQRALKAVEKYNTLLNHQRFVGRSHYYDLQTNMVHFPRREVKILPSDPELDNLISKAGDHSGLIRSNSHAACLTTRKTGAYPVSLMFHPAQYVDHVPKFSSKELGFMPLNTVIHSANPYAVSCLNMTAEECRLLKRKRNDGMEESSRDGTPLLTDEEPSEKDVQAPDVDLEEMELDSDIDLPDEALIMELEMTAPMAKGRGRGRPSEKKSMIKKQRRESKVESVEMEDEEVAEEVEAQIPKFDDFIPSDSCYLCYVRDKSKVKVEVSEEPDGSGKKKNRRAAAVLDAVVLATEDLISCSKCTKKYHPTCMQLPRTTQFKLKTYPWICTDCKVCTKCKSSAKEEKMMFCDLCDRGYHTFCAKSKVGRVPLGRWLCEHCGLCSLCGANRPNDEGKRGRACIWQFDCEEDSVGNVTAVKTICYRCHKERKLAAKAKESDPEGDAEDNNIQEEDAEPEAE